MSITFQVQYPSADAINFVPHDMKSKKFSDFTLPEIPSPPTSTRAAKLPSPRVSSMTPRRTRRTTEASAASSVIGARQGEKRLLEMEFQKFRPKIKRLREFSAM